MTAFRDLSAEDVATQHQLLIEMLLYILLHGDKGLLEQAANSVDKSIALMRDENQDTSILEYTASFLRSQSVQE